MKKIFSIILVAIAAVSLFATEGDTQTSASYVNPATNSSYSLLFEPFQPLTPRAIGMGSAGVATTGRSDTFYLNPAALASKRFQLSLPSAQVTVYHIYDMYKSGFLGNLFKGQYDGLGDVLTSIKAGDGKLADVDAGLSFTAGGFGLGVNARVSAITFGPAVGGLDSLIYARANAAVTLGYGFRFELPSDFSIDLGAMVRFNYMAYTQTIGAEDLADASESESFDIAKLLQGKKIAAGFSVPIDVGLNVDMPAGFTLGVVARNLNGRYYMTAFTGYEEFLQNPFGSKVKAEEKFNIDSNWSLDAGLGWSLSTWFLSPTLSVDVKDIVGLATTQNIGWRDFMYHLSVGAELRLLSFLDLRAGLNQGYWTLGVGLDLWAVKIDIAYFRQEFGKTAGDYGLDGITVRVNIGYDR